MRAMLLQRLGAVTRESDALQQVELPVPEPAGGEIRIRVTACGVCHTELDEIEGRTPPPRLPIVPGHEVVGIVDKVGPNAVRHRTGDRVGIGWIHHGDGTPQENLTGAFAATGRDAHGGYAEYMTVPHGYAYPIPEQFSDVQAAPLLCAGAVGYRALKLTHLENGQSLGLTGFGGSAHIVLQLVRYRYPNSPLFVFARDPDAREFALSLGADWAGASHEKAPAPLDAIIDTTPAWQPVLDALLQLSPGGRLVINAIRKEDGDRACMGAVDYAEHLWMEKEIKTVANVTHSDIAEFLPLAARAGVKTHVTEYALEDANQALRDLKFNPVTGAKVLTM